ncbi:MAG: hypothetical protein GY841_10790 [FCB group bacterium]|nr:hypothetical protein [FCB group bacterium]
MKQTVKFLLPLTIIMALLVPGCYTIMTHPMGDEGYRASQVSDCTRCHDDFHEYPYGYYYSPYPDYWWEYGAYGSYYVDPWWWSYYDYPYIEGEYQGSSHRGTKFDRQEHSGAPTLPPYANPSDGYIRPPITPGSNFIDGSTGDGNSNGTARPQTGTVEDNSSSRAKDQGDATVKSTRQSTKSSGSSGKNTRPAIRPAPKSTPKVETPKADTPKKEEPPPEKPKPDESKKGSGGGR